MTAKKVIKHQHVEVEVATPPPTRRRLAKHTSDPVFQERDKQRSLEARAWVKEELVKFFDAHRGTEVTPADILADFNNRTDDLLHPSWIRFLGDYGRQYSMIKDACDALHRTGWLEAGLTINAKHQEAKCYRRPPDAPEFIVDASGPAAERVRSLAYEWLRKLSAEDLTGLNGLLIVPKEGANNGDLRYRRDQLRRTTKVA